MDSENSGYFTNLLSSRELDPLMQNDDFINDMSSQAFAQVSEILVENQPLTKKKERSTNYLDKEDCLFISAWLNVSVDPIKGNDQKSTAYWERIAAFYHEHKTFETNRDASSLQDRWQKVQKSVNKFCGYWTQVEN